MDANSAGCVGFLALLEEGLDLHVYNLIIDILLVVAVWDIGLWWAKAMLAFILVQHVAGALLRRFI